MANRLRRLLQVKNGGNQSEMARFVGVSPQAVQKWMNGTTEPKGRNLQLAAEFLGVSVETLLFGAKSEGKAADAGVGLAPPASRQGEFPSEKRHVEREQPYVHSLVRAYDPDDGVDDDVVLVPESRIQFAAGDGQIAYELVEESEPATYRRSWFQKEGMNPDRVRRFRVSGDSQEPFLYDRDTILVNQDETTVIDGKLYALRYGEHLRVKFLRRLIDGTLILRSMNPSYKDEEISADVANEHITIIGRVRDKSGRGGL